MEIGDSPLGNYESKEILDKFEIPNSNCFPNSHGKTKSNQTDAGLQTSADTIAVFFSFSVNCFTALQFCPLFAARSSVGSNKF